jgi:CRP-like cAMP-binding protein
LRSGVDGGSTPAASRGALVLRRNLRASHHHAGAHTAVQAAFVTAEPERAATSTRRGVKSTERPAARVGSRRCGSIPGLAGVGTSVADHRGQETHTHVTQRRGTTITDCKACPIGTAAGVARGYRCPLNNRTRPAGTLVYVEGESAERLWLIKRGAVVLTRDSGERVSEGAAWAVRRAGAFIGIEALVRGTYADSARAESEVVLCGASRDEFARWVDSEPQAARAVLRLVLDAHSGDVPRRAGSAGSALRRTACWLLEEAPHGAAHELQRRHVAQMLGMVPETFSRALARLAACGAIELSRRTIRIRDLYALENAAARV